MTETEVEAGKEGVLDRLPPKDADEKTLAAFLNSEMEPYEEIFRSSEEKKKIIAILADLKESGFLTTEESRAFMESLGKRVTNIVGIIVEPINDAFIAKYKGEEQDLEKTIKVLFERQKLWIPKLIDLEFILAEHNSVIQRKIDEREETAEVVADNRKFRDVENRRIQTINEKVMEGLS